MSKTIAYVRVSTDGQELKNQKLEILQYSDKHDLKINEWLEVTISSRKNRQARLIDLLLEKLKPNDCLIVSELSRLGRSVGQVITIMDELVHKKVKVIVIKQSLVIQESDIQSKTMVTLLSLFADIERDLISERTKSGLARAKAEGKLIGRPPGLGKSRLDGKENEIVELLEKQVSISSIAKIMGVTWPCCKHFIRTRNLKPENKT